MSCPGNYEQVTPVTVTVRDTANGDYVCNAHVTAKSFASSLAVVEQGSDAGLSDAAYASCQYEIAPTQAGTYVIQATAPGLHMTQSAPTLTIQMTECGPSYYTLDVTIPMSP
jgi:hypothetical protein